jgi:site-specific DNA recombinase
MSRPPIRLSLYARYSSENQRDASIEERLRQCRERAAPEGCAVVDGYFDREISGTSLVRAGIRELRADAQAGAFDTVPSEALDRTSRDQADVAAVAHPAPDLSVNTPARIFLDFTSSF